MILVVAADDGVMSQTKEAINHAKAAQVPIIVALNKIDRPEANPDRVKRELADAGLQPDEWEGDTFVVPVSAKKKIGLDDLLETVLLVEDNLTILANPKGKCIGTVVEAKLDKTTGPMATLLVQNGSLAVGDTVVAGEATGKIKAMFDQRQKRVSKVGPSTPVMVMGLTALPEAGDLFQVVANEREGRAIVAERRAAREAKRSTKRATLEEAFQRYKAGEAKELRLILKADVQGSLEPIVNSLDSFWKRRNGRRRWRRLPTRWCLVLTWMLMLPPAAWPRPRASPSVCTKSSTVFWKMWKKLCKACWNLRWWKK